MYKIAKDKKSSLNKAVVVGLGWLKSVEDCQHNDTLLFLMKASNEGNLRNSKAEGWGNSKHPLLNRNEALLCLFANIKILHAEGNQCILKMQLTDFVSKKALLYS